MPAYTQKPPMIGTAPRHRPLDRHCNRSRQGVGDEMSNTGRDDAAHHLYRRYRRQQRQSRERPHRHKDNAARRMMKPRVRTRIEIMTPPERIGGR
jgi:hypothetical protein